MSGSWAAGWAVGDVLTATELSKSMGAIFDSTLGSGAASFNITSIPSGYAHLRLVLQGRGDTSAATVLLQLRFNASSSPLYYDVRGGFTDAAAFETGDVGAQDQAIFGLIPAATAVASYFGATVVDIPNYSGTTAYKNFISVGYLLSNSGTGNQQVQICGGGLASAAAISSLTVFPAFGNFVTGTRATLYVMGP